MIFDIWLLDNSALQIYLWYGQDRPLRLRGGRKRCPAAATNSSLYFAVICDIIASSDNMLFRGERMRIEFRTVYDRIEFEIFGQLYAKHCIEKQLKQLNNIRLAIVIICVLGFVLGLASDITAKDKFIPYTLFPFFLIFTLVYMRGTSRVNGYSRPIANLWG